GNVPAGWLGIKANSVAQLSDAEILPLGLQQKAGVIVRQLAPEGPAAQAGMMVGDIITRLNDFDVAGEADLRAMLSPMPAGQAVTLGAIRNHQVVELKAVLGARPVTEQVPLMNPFDLGFEPIAAQRKQLTQRLVELKSQYRTYQQKPLTRETAEA